MTLRPHVRDTFVPTEAMTSRDPWNLPAARTSQKRSGGPWQYVNLVSPPWFVEQRSTSAMYPVGAVQWTRLLFYGCFLTLLLAGSPVQSKFFRRLGLWWRRHSRRFWHFIIVRLTSVRLKLQCWCRLQTLLPVKTIFESLAGLMGPKLQLFCTQVCLFCFISVAYWKTLSRLLSINKYNN